jgi:hypothetical protein
MQILVNNQFFAKRALSWQKWLAAYVTHSRRQFPCFPTQKYQAARAGDARPVNSSGCDSLRDHNPN